jgi:hypothetical protein
MSRPWSCTQAAAPDQWLRTEPPTALHIDLASTAATRMCGGKIALAQTERIRLKPALKATRMRVARNSVYPQVTGRR